MPTTRLRRSLALVTAATLLASLTAATVASPASAAKPKCQGFKATIVGTKKAEVIRGTAKRDIIVAKGGNDRIFGRGGNDIICAGGGNDTVYGGPGADRLWGQLGRDRLLGNAGPDFLAGQVGNDTLVGGIGVDTCFQGTGTGPVSRCERPAPPAPPPSGPTIIPLTGILAVAYSDIDGLDGYSTGDVMIALLRDTSGDGRPGANDTIEMGRYPTNFDATAFGEWANKTHVVASVERARVDWLKVKTTANGDHSWELAGTVDDRDDIYMEIIATGQSSITDHPVPGNTDRLRYEAGSPSQPAVLTASTQGLGDEAFIDVELNYPEVP